MGGARRPVVDELLAACWEDTLDPGPYALAEGAKLDLGKVLQGDRFFALLGTSGDVNNINFRHPRPGQAPYAQMRFVADDVAGKVHAALAKALTDSRQRVRSLRWARPRSPS